MSYCRKNMADSDVYVYRHETGITCNGCDLRGGYDIICVDTPGEMLDHLLDHTERGDMVPERATERLQREKDEDE